MAKPIDISKFAHLYPFASHYLNLGGLRYHYLDEGHGDPVVMVHGNPTWSFYFRRLALALRSEYRVIVPDHIGCGLSDKPARKDYSYRLQNRIDDLQQLIDRLEPERRLTLVLHDWGGAIGMGLAVRIPERIGRIVVLNTAAFLPPPGKVLPLRLRLVRNLPALALPAVLGLNLFARAAVWMAPRRRLAPEVRAGLTAPYNSWQNRIATLMFVRDIPVHSRDPSYTAVKEIDANLDRLSGRPMLICWGMHDFVFDRDYLAEWRRRFPAADVHECNEAGHYLLEDAPRKITGLIQRFLKTHPLENDAEHRP